jgi:Zn-dependent peptidase ImmA (M78 family)
VNRNWNAYAKRLEAALSPATRRELASSPLAGVRGAGVRVRAVATSDATDECSCDGAYFHDQRAICYVATPRSRRENFTVLHELGHHLVMSDDDLLSELADVDAVGGVGAEERICDAFAGRLLIPDEAIAAVLGGRRPRAADVRALYDATAGSMEACAVRLAERISCEGYVALLDRERRQVRFASQSAEFEYVWRRGTSIPRDHSVWQTGVNGTFVGQGDVVWTSRYRKRFWLDAVGAGTVIIAVFSADCYWAHDGLTILDDPGVTRAAPPVSQASVATVEGQRTEHGRVSCAVMPVAGSAGAADAARRLLPSRRARDASSQRERPNSVPEQWSVVLATRGERVDQRSCLGCQLFRHWTRIARARQRDPMCLLRGGREEAYQWAYLRPTPLGRSSSRAARNGLSW